VSLGALLAQGRHARCQMILANIGDNDATAGPAEHLRLPQPDAAAAAGNECHFALEIFHFSLL